MSAMTGRNVFITGANTGIGRETALALARLGAHITIGSRSRERTEAVLDALEDMGAGYDHIACDLASLESVRQCAATFAMKERPIHVLLNNAGLGGTTGVTEDGFELTFGVNHIGHFLLTQLLMPHIKAAASKAAPARIVNVSSKAHTGCRKIEYARLERPSRGWFSYRNYQMSKLANILHARELASRHQADHIHTYSLHPGVVASDIWRILPWPLRPLLTMRMIDEVAGAKTSVFCASSQDVNVVGTTAAFYDECKIVKPSRASRDDDMAAVLWQKSLEWCGLAQT